MKFITLENALTCEAMRQYLTLLKETHLEPEGLALRRHHWSDCPKHGDLEILCTILSRRAQGSRYTHPYLYLPLLCQYH
jgi:hypothetical protein